MGGQYTVTVDDTARIAIVLKKLDEAKNRLYEATKIYEHILDDRSTPLDVAPCVIQAKPECDD